MCVIGQSNQHFISAQLKQIVFSKGLTEIIGITHAQRDTHTHTHTRAHHLF